MMKPRISLFAEHERETRRSTIGDPLVGLTKHVDFEALALSIDNAAPQPSRAKGGRPPYPTALMVKILVLQQLYNLADDALEYQLLDRRSFFQFLDLTESSSIPDAKSIGLFRDRLAQAGACTLVFDQVQQQPHQHGYLARCGQITDASLVQAPVQRNKREEADTVKEGTMPLARKPYKRAQKDVDSRWTKKHGKNYSGYELHASIDERCKLIRKLAVTHAAVSDSIVFEELLDSSNTSRDAYADRGYPSAEREENLTKAGWRVQIQRKGTASRGISATQKRRNRRIATPRARVEHVFGALAQMGGKFVRCKGIVRTTLSLHLKAAVYNLKRLVFLKESDSSRSKRGGSAHKCEADPFAQATSPSWLPLPPPQRTLCICWHSQQLKTHARRTELTISASLVQKAVIRGGLKNSPCSATTRTASQHG